MLYKKIHELGGKPVLISENYLVPGELVIVPETSELFAVLFYNDGKECKIPDGVQWYRWFSDKENPETVQVSKIPYKIDYDSEYTEEDYREGRLLNI